MVRTDRDAKQLNRDEQQTFLSILHRNSRGGAIICNQLRHGEVVSIDATKNYEHIYCESLENDVYVSVNSFCSSGSAFVSRKASNVYSINAMYIDLDLPGHERNEDSETIIQENLDAIHKAVSDGKLPRYTMITSTGNGIGVFFVLTNSIANTDRTEKQQKYFDTLYDLLAERMQFVLSVCGKHALVVDTSVVGDHARICRLPGTRNSKSGTMCTILEVNQLGYCTLHEYGKILSKKKTKAVKSKQKNAGEKRFVSSFFHAQLLMKLDNLAKERASWLGHRELFCFVYYNTAKQCLEYQDAIKALCQFNDGLGDRIDETQIKSIIKAVDNNIAWDGSYAGYYKLTNAWIAGKLGLTNEEIKKYEFDGGCGWEDRNQQAHLIVVRRKIDTQRKIVELLTSDDRPTYDAVSTATGSSVSTVKRIAAKYNIRKRDNNVVNINWDELYQNEVNEYKEQRLEAYQKRVKTCTSVVIVPKQEVTTVNEVEDAIVGNQVDRNKLFETTSVLSAVHDYTISNGWISTDASFDELTDGSIPFVSDIENPFEVCELNENTLAEDEQSVSNVIVFHSDETENGYKTEKTAHQKLNAGDVIVRNEAYGNSFLRYIMDGAGERTLKMYQGFADVFYSKTNAYRHNNEYEQSNLLYVLLDMIADKTSNSASVDLCLWELDKLYRFLALDSGNLRDYEVSVSAKDVSGYVAPSDCFEFNPEYKQVSVSKPAAGAKTNPLRPYELTKSDMHIVTVAHLMDTDSYQHMIDVLSVAADRCISSESESEQAVGIDLGNLLKHLPTFGAKRMKNLMEALKSVPVEIGSTELVKVICDALRCKPEKIGTIRNSFDKMRRQTPAQKQAGQIFRRHQDAMNWCRREKWHNLTCRTYLAAYHAVCNEYKTSALVIGDKMINAEDIRKKYLYPLSVETLKTMPELHTITDLVNWLINKENKMNVM